VNAPGLVIHIDIKDTIVEGRIAGGDDDERKRLLFENCVVRDNCFVFFGL
jgi:hypothetical protein